MAIILPNNLLAMQLPQACVVVAARGDEVRRVGGERAIPHPALVARQRALEFEGPRLGRRLARCRHHRLQVLDLPNLGRVVGAACCQVLDIGREENSRDVLCVRFEVCYRHQLRLLTVL